MVTIINYITHIYVLCKPTCRQRCDERLLQAEGPFKCVAFGASAKGAARADFACVAGLVGRRYGGASGANDNAGKWLECAGEKKTDTVGHYRVGRSAGMGVIPPAIKARGVVQTAAPPYPCGKERSGSLLPWEPLSLLLQ